MTDPRLPLAALAVAVVVGAPGVVAGNPSTAGLLATLRAPPGREIGAGHPGSAVDVPGAPEVPEVPGVPGAPAPRWRWPLSPRPTVARPFDAPASPWGRGHRGLDLAASPGAPVRAVEAGTVTHAGVVAGRGTVTLVHADGLSSTYEPVAVSVEVGAHVEVGDVLGVLEDVPVAHCGAGSCLHLGARRRPAYLDPLPLLTGGGRLRLMPLARGP